MLELLLRVVLLCSQPPAPAEPPKPAQTEQPPQSKATELNLLGATDSAAGESRRNENVQFNLIDNNALKYLNIRLGTTATIVTEFRPERKYFGTEFGASPAGAIHLSSRNTPAAFHAGLSFTRSDSIFSARSFFQAGGVQPTHENDYSFTLGGAAWRGAHVTLEGTQQTIRGSVNGNVLVPLAAERTPLTTDPAIRRLVQRWIDAYPQELPNRTDIDPRALNTNSPQSIDTAASTVRVDQILGPNDRVSLQHSFTN